MVLLSGSWRSLKLDICTLQLLCRTYTRCAQTTLRDVVSRLSHSIQCCPAARSMTLNNFPSLQASLSFLPVFIFMLAELQAPAPSGQFSHVSAARDILPEDPPPLIRPGDMLLSHTGLNINGCCNAYDKSTEHFYHPKELQAGSLKSVPGDLPELLKGRP